MKNLGAIILAAGKGKRMHSKNLNKVVLPLGDKPMILHEIEFLKNFSVDPIVVVVGFAKNSVEEVLKGTQVYFAVQKKRLGTAHAVSQGMTVLPSSVENVLVINGDDSFFYRKENAALIEKLIEKHFSANASMTFLTVQLNDNFGSGRIIRDSERNVLEIVEEKDATEIQRSIKEVNVGCYVFKVSFLRKYLKKIQKSKTTGEYYLVSLVALGVQNKEKIETVEAGPVTWRGINTEEELEKAKQLFSQIT